MNYSYQLSELSPTREKYTFTMSFELFFRLLCNDEKFRSLIINIFINTKFTYVFWQFPVYSKESKYEPAYFEFVKAPAFVIADPRDFSNQFAGKNSGEIVVFKSLSRDTTLISIVPTENENVNETISDISTFMTKAPNIFKNNMLRIIGSEMLKQNSPCFLSTHGKCVNWLHIRMCKSAKYYV